MTLTPGLHPVPSGHLAAVVTSLEMTAPATSKPKPFPAGFGATRERLSVYDYQWLFREIGAPWLWASRLVMDEDALNTILTDKNVETWVIRQANAAVGLIELDFRITDTCELAFFGLISDATGQGLGGAMMELAKEQAFARPISRFHVHTCTLDSPHALGFYQKAGFAAHKREIEVFSDPRIDGVLPSTSAAHIPCLK
jgi:ribosomal protein S18 acetylase RimI-like enzyme